MTGSGEEYRYVAIIGDLVGSRKLEDRGNAQLRLNEILEDVNENYSNEIASRFTVTLGDEFQGLLLDGGPAMDIITSISIGMGSVKVRYGIGIGRIVTEINPGIAIGADGPAYNCAREAINAVKLAESQKQRMSVSFLIRSEDKEMPFLDTACRLMYAVSDRWSPRQKEIICDMLLRRDSQVAVASRFGIKQPTVQHALSSGYYYSYADSYDAIVKYLSEVNRLDF